MNEEIFNMSVRKFLKKVGVTAQREIELSVREAVARGRAKTDSLPVKVVLTLPATGLAVTIDGDIALG